MNLTQINKQPSQLLYLVFAHILILFGYVFNRGIFFHQAQLWLLLIGWVLLLLPLLKKSLLKFILSNDVMWLLLMANLINFFFFFTFDRGIYPLSEQATLNVMLLKFVALIFFLLYLVKFNFQGKNFFSAIFLHLAKYKFIYLVLLAIFLRLAVVFYSPTPVIDVFWFSDQGASSFLNSQNPYAEIYYKVYSWPGYINNVYSYWPSTILFTSFFKAIFGDVRFAYIFAQLGIAALAYLLLKDRTNNLIAQLMSLMVLYAPLSLFVIEQTWNEPLSLLLLYLFVWLIFSGKQMLPFFIFGLFLGVKQLSLIYLLFLTIYQKINLQKYLMVLGIMLLVILPFFFWSPVDFINDTFIHHLNYDPPLFSLSFNTLYKTFFFSNIPDYFSLTFLAGLLIFLLMRVKRDLSGIIHGAVVFLLALFLIKQGFANYYYGISGAVILLIILELRRLTETKT